jgi:hypothetical protein
MLLSCKRLAELYELTINREIPEDPIIINNNVNYWVDNGDGTFTAQAGATLWGLYGSEWQRRSGYIGDPARLQAGTIVGRNNVLIEEFDTGIGLEIKEQFGDAYHNIIRDFVVNRLAYPAKRVSAEEIEAYIIQHSGELSKMSSFEEFVNPDFSVEDQVNSMAENFETLLSNAGTEVGRAEFLLQLAENRELRDFAFSFFEVVMEDAKEEYERIRNKYFGVEHIVFETPEGKFINKPVNTVKRELREVIDAAQYMINTIRGIENKQRFWNGMGERPLGTLVDEFVMKDPETMRNFALNVILLAVKGGSFVVKTGMKKKAAALHAARLKDTTYLTRNISSINVNPSVVHPTRGIIRLPRESSLVEMPSEPTPSLLTHVRKVIDVEQRIIDLFVSKILPSRIDMRDKK